MRALAWVLIWGSLLALAGWWLWVRLRRLWATARDLGETAAELESLATATSMAIDAETGRRAKVSGRHTPAVGRPRRDAVATRESARENYRAFRAQRRRARTPGWARDVDFDTSATERKTEAP